MLNAGATLGELTLAGVASYPAHAVILTPRADLVVVTRDGFEAALRMVYGLALVDKTAFLAGGPLLGRLRPEEVEEVAGKLGDVAWEAGEVVEFLRDGDVAMLVAGKAVLEAPGAMRGAERRQGGGYGG